MVESLENDGNGDLNLLEKHVKALISGMRTPPPQKQEPQELEKQVTPPSVLFIILLIFQEIYMYLTILYTLLYSNMMNPCVDHLLRRSEMLLLLLLRRRRRLKIIVVHPLIPVMR